MDIIANRIIDWLGGSTATSRLTETPLSTVHSWRKNGIPPSRLAHIRLAAKVDGKELPENLDDLPPAKCEAEDQQADAA